MPNLNNFERQSPLAFDQVLSFDDLTNGQLAAKIQVALPVGAIVLSGGLIIETPWNSATTATLDVGDTALNTRFATGLNIKSAAGSYLPFTSVGIKQATGLNITFKLNETGAAATAGQLRVVGTYIVIGRAHEVME